MKTKRITTIAMLTALYVVLAILTPVKIQYFKFTFEALPILVAGFLFGSKVGFTVATLGSCIYQLFFSQYGFTATTVLWILPHSISGLLIGYLSEKKEFILNKKDILLISIVGCLTVTALNTLALFIDSKIYGYYNSALLFSALPLKILSGIILSVLFTAIIIPLLKAVNKQL
ncbi:MAG: ECF transporter S component [Erysipelotrichia bacterium]|nr:ECF transporter S component [Erysipelotrichia bacterium]